MKAISLFSGIGGFDLAARRCGIDVVAHSEICPRAEAVYRNHFPDSKALGPVETVDPTDPRSVPEFDCLFAGWPCQDFSVAGRRRGLAGERSGLFHHVARILEACLPRWFCLENVPGLLSSHQGRDLRRIARQLTKLGYGLAWRVLDAQHFGIPQRRRRVLFVGCRGEPTHPAEILFERDRLPWDPPPRREAETESAGTLTSSFGGRGGPRIDSARYSLLGLAVPPPVVEWVLRRLVKREQDVTLRSPALARD